MITYQQYVEVLIKRGYRVKENLAFMETPFGVWIQRIVKDPNGPNGFALVTVLNPYNKAQALALTDEGIKNVNSYIREMAAKRKEILDAGMDTAEIDLPTADLIEEDVNFLGIDQDGEYYNGWAVTDHYDADYPLLLKIGRDLRAVYVN